MLTVPQRDRYLRHILLKDIGSQGQQKLLSTRVLVVGAGGIGSPLLQYLSAAGFGNITIIDPDKVELSNLQRQTIFCEADIEQLKAVAARDFCRALNKDITVTAVPERLDAQKAAALFKEHDLVIEGVDNFETRFLINQAAMVVRVPFISAAVGRFEGHLAVFDPAAGDLPCYQCFVPEIPPRDEVVDCLEEGVIGALTGIVGSLAAMEAIKTTLDLGDGLRGRLLIYDGLGGTMRRIKLPRDPACPACATLSRP